MWANVARRVGIWRQDDLLPPAAATELHGDVHVERVAFLVRFSLLAIAQFRNQAAQSVGAEADVQAVGVDYHLLDQQLDDPLSFGREQLISHRIELLESVPNSICRSAL